MKTSFDKSTLKLPVYRKEPNPNTEENTDILQPAQPASTPETSPRYSANREQSDHHESRSPRKISKESRLRMIDQSRKSEETVSLKSSPRREGRLPLKKLSSSDPSETANVSSQLTRKKNSHGETKKSVKEHSSSAPMDSGSDSQKQISRSKSPEKSRSELSPSDDSKTLPLTPTRLSSPRIELIKSTREEGFFKQHTKMESSSTSDASTPKIVVPPKRSSASREHKIEP